MIITIINHNLDPNQKINTKIKRKKIPECPAEKNEICDYHYNNISESMTCQKIRIIEEMLLFINEN